MKYILIIVLFISSCAVGPNFTSPTLNLPHKIGCDTLPRDLMTAPPTALWWSRFGDKYLDSLVQKALNANKDIKIAKKRLEISKLSYQNSRAALAPSLGVQSQAEAKYSKETKIAQSYSLSPTMSWELDIFGGGRRAKEAAMAATHSVSYQYNGVLLAIVADVVQNYFTLLEYRVALEISKKSYETRRKSYDLMVKMFDLGAISKVALNQAYTLLLSASISVNNYKNSITEVSTSLSQLLGENPHCFEINSFAIFNIKTPTLPSTILPAWIVDNRPDIMQAYYDVWASSANIGIAVSKRFPTVSLNADAGVLYNIVQGVTTTMPFVWNGTFSIAESLLNFGINKRNVEIAKLNNKETIITFEKSVLTAFGEIENAISQISSFTIQEKEYTTLVNTTYSINYMTNELYNKGMIDYLQVLDAERSLFDAQIQHSSTLSQKLISYVSLYKAIGGGW